MQVNETQESCLRALAITAHLSKGDDGADRASRWMSPAGRRSGADSDYNDATDLSWKLGSGDDVPPRLSAF